MANDYSRLVFNLCAIGVWKNFRGDVWMLTICRMEKSDKMISNTIIRKKIRFSFGDTKSEMEMELLNSRLLDNEKMSYIV